ncbi:ABC transporter permease [Nocardioides jishulii]|uniref:ABC transporter permease n=1 Tax=Nocardioides jishulii TaxID=2575440 RepID=A0A4U2YR77_9ACTN|nr:ABC transporter permease [Nocardioides jishulii]QCX26287.1 ABC transporter permease [Nocardioides jishulii]TKI63909.1 ABC transporter permease [Nocardioides jishulii]
MPSLLKERAEPKLNPRQEASAGVTHVSRYRRNAARGGRGVVGVLLLAVVWEVAPRLEIVPSYVVFPLSDVLVAWWELFTSGRIWGHLEASLVRSVIGFGLAVATAIPLGTAIAWYPPVRELLSPVLEIFRNTAALAILPVFVLVFGIGETSKVAIVLFACFFPILLSTISGVATVDPQLLRSARVLGLSPVTTFRKVVFPAAVPQIFTGIRMAGAAAILVLIAAEMIGATAGVGFLITYSQNNFLYPQMYAAILTTTALGLIVNGSLVALEKRLSRWRV